MKHFYWILVGSVFIMTGCGSSSKTPGGTAKDRDYSELPAEVSLKDDRAHLESLRKDIPQDIRDQNDETAFILKSMGDMNDRPERVRDRFNTAMRKKREAFQRINKKDREEYNKKEKKEREEFLANLKKKRDDYISSKPKPEARRQFFSEQETERQVFFSEQREARRAFDSELRQRQSDFDANARDLNTRFTQEHREYSERFRKIEKDNKELKEQQRRLELEKLKNQTPTTSTGASESSQLSRSIAPGSDDPHLKNYDQMNKGPKQPLIVDDE